MLLNTTSAPVVTEICLVRAVTWVALSDAGGSKTLNWMGKSQNDAT